MPPTTLGPSPLLVLLLLFLHVLLPGPNFNGIACVFIPVTLDFVFIIIAVWANEMFVLDKY